MEESKYQLKIISVSEVPGSTALNRSILRRMGQQPVTVDMSVKMVSDISRNIISLIVTCSYLTKSAVLRQRLLTCSAIATFEIDNLSAHAVSHGGEVSVDDELLHTMLSIAVGALRGVVAVRTADTPLRHRPLPVIDLRALMSRLNYGRRK